MEMHYNKNQQYGVPFETYREIYAGSDPQALSEACGVPFDSETRQFSIRLLGQEYRISHPDFEVSCPGQAEAAYAPLLTEDAARILVIRYLTFGKKALFMGTFRPYSEMPWGNVYERNFQGRCIQRLAFTFGRCMDKFHRAMERLGAESIPSSGAAYEIAFLDDLRLRLTVWEADEEFPPSAQILFSDNFPYAFSGEDMAYVGDLVILTLKKLSEA